MCNVQILSEFKLVSLSYARFPAGSPAHPALRQPRVPDLLCSSATSRAAGRKQWLPGLQEVVHSLVAEIANCLDCRCFQNKTSPWHSFCERFHEVCVSVQLRIRHFPQISVFSGRAALPCDAKYCQCQKDSTSDYQNIAVLLFPSWHISQGRGRQVHSKQPLTVTNQEVGSSKTKFPRLSHKCQRLSIGIVESFSNLYPGPFCWSWGRCSCPLPAIQRCPVHLGRV